MNVSTAILSALLSISWSESKAGPGQEEPPCPEPLSSETRAAVSESAWYVSGAGGVRTERDDWARAARLGLGGEVSYPMATLIARPRYGGDLLLRAGPWAQLSTSLHGVLFEAGWHAVITQAYHAQWGTYVIRVGAGHGNDLGRVGSHLHVTVAGGVHSFLDRYTPRQPCSRPSRPDEYGMGSVLRIFGTWRKPFDANARQEIIFGLEFSPTFLLPPHTLWRWGGGPPR